ncbi:MAG: hypothetical protein WAV41_03200 [Microgenomates group bacterium]
MPTVNGKTIVPVNVHPQYMTLNEFLKAGVPANVPGVATTPPGTKTHLATPKAGKSTADVTAIRPQPTQQGG